MLCKYKTGAPDPQTDGKIVPLFVVNRQNLYSLADAPLYQT